MLRDSMKKGDTAFFYHSSCEVPGIAGIVRIVKDGYPDKTAFDRKHHHYDPESKPTDPRWYVVDVKLSASSSTSSRSMSCVGMRTTSCRTS